MTTTAIVALACTLLTPGTLHRPVPRPVPSAADSADSASPARWAVRVDRLRDLDAAPPGIEVDCPSRIDVGRVIRIDEDGRTFAIDTGDDVEGFRLYPKSRITPALGGMRRGDLVRVVSASITSGIGPAPPGCGCQEIRIVGPLRFP